MRLTKSEREFLESIKLECFDDVTMSEILEKDNEDIYDQCNYCTWEGGCDQAGKNDEHCDTFDSGGE